MTAYAILAATIPSVLPTSMVLVGILNNNDANHLRTSISELRGEVHSSISRLRGEMNGMRSEIHTDINGLRSDIRMLTAANSEIGKRVSRLEDKG